MKSLNVHINIVKDPITGIEIPEIWKDIPGFKNRYQVSNMGRVRSKDWTAIRSDGKPYPNKGRVLSQNKNIHGYFVACLKKGRIKKTSSVHRLVAICFVENPDHKPLALHKDGVRTNNFYLNLYWGDYSDNTIDSIRHGTHVGNVGEKNGQSKLTRKDVITIRSLLKNTDYTHQEIADKFEVAQSVISNIKNRKAWSHV